MINEQNTNKVNILIGISMAGGIGILPFCLYRLANQDWITGIFDLIASLGMMTLALYVYRTKRINVAIYVLAIITLIVLVFTMYNKGIQQAYWIFPALASTYFILKPKFAALYSIITIVLISPVLYQQATMLTFSAIIITLVITLAFAFIFATEVNAQRDMLLEQATKDPLTGAGNRRALAEKLNQQIASMQRTSSKSTALLLDMDHFKKINDKFGHHAGDRFLVKLTKALRSRIRVTDSLFRFGGEEFIVIAENTDLEAGRVLAEELRSTIENGNLIPEAVTTVSIGVAELQADENDESWIKRADDALFKAKESGRNQVYISGHH